MSSKKAPSSTEPPKVPMYDYVKSKGSEVPASSIPPNMPVYAAGGVYLGKGAEAIPHIGDPRPDGGKFHGGVIVRGEDGTPVAVVHRTEPSPPAAPFWYR